MTPRPRAISVMNLNLFQHPAKPTLAAGEFRRLLADKPKFQWQSALAALSIRPCRVLRTSPKS
jgi:hypothetical protein